MRDNRTRDAIKNLDQELLGNSESLLAGGEVKIFFDVPGSPPTVLKLRFLKRKHAFTGRFRPWARSVGNSKSRAGLAGSPFIPAHPEMLGDAALPGGRQTRPGSSQCSG